MSDRRCYLTTAIPYVNARPHLGHALELVLADVLARHRALRGYEVRLQSGTDDNAAKNAAAAAQAGVPTQRFVDANASRFHALLRPLEVDVDDFVRTSADPRHRAGVERLWHDCADDFYQRAYVGLYCRGCEQFYLESELSDGRCPEHGAVSETISETNWFFRLSRYQGQLLDVLGSGQVRIVPDVRRNEVLSFVRGGLSDISVSRPAERSNGWGIPVPGDPAQIVYVWWDALGNYVTTLGYGTDNPEYRRWWAESDERVHVIGKGIVRFHAVYWLAMLLATGQRLPTGICVHDYLTVNGEKISKSAGNSVDPVALVDVYGIDAVRWWLLREVALVGETDFTTDRLITSANADLAGGFGNLVQRVAACVHKFRGGRVPQEGGSALAAARAALPGRIDSALGRCDTRAATAALVDVVDAANRFIERRRPWDLAKHPESGRELDETLTEVVATCRVLATELSPFLPSAAARLQRQLSGDVLPAPRPTFDRIGQ